MAADRVLDLAISTATRWALSATLTETLAVVKRRREQRASGQSSLFGDDSSPLDEHKKRVQGLIEWRTRELLQTPEFLDLLQEAGEGRRKLPRIDTSPEDDRIFWEYHRKKAKAGK